MLTSTFMIGFSILMTYALAIGACMAILQSEFLKKGYIWFYRILIALNVIGITVFIEKCFTVEKIRRENYFLIFASVSYVIFLVQLVWILAGSVKGRCNNQKMVPRETYDLKEEWLETEENIKICYTQKKNEEGFTPGSSIKPYYTGNTRHQNYTLMPEIGYEFNNKWEAGLEIGIKKGDVCDRLILRTNSLASTSVCTVTESELIHTCNHLLSTQRQKRTFVAFRRQTRRSRNVPDITRYQSPFARQ